MIKKYTYGNSAEELTINQIRSELFMMNNFLKDRGLEKYTESSRHFFDELEEELERKMQGEFANIEVAILDEAKARGWSQKVLRKLLGLEVSRNTRRNDLRIAIRTDYGEDIYSVSEDNAVSEFLNFYQRIGGRWEAIASGL